MRVPLSRNSNMYRAARWTRSASVRLAKRLSGVHPSASIHWSSQVSRDFRAEKYTFVGPGCHIGPGTSVGAYSMLAPRVAVVGDDHVIDRVGVPIQFTGRPPQQRTVIGTDVWVGYGVIIRRGVTIGDGAVIAAGAVVVRDVPPYEVWAGVPARHVRRRFSPGDQERHDQALHSGDVQPAFAGRQSL